MHLHEVVILFMQHWLLRWQPHLPHVVFLRRIHLLLIVLLHHMLLVGDHGRRRLHEHLGRGVHLDRLFLLHHLLIVLLLDLLHHGLLLRLHIINLLLVIRFKLRLIVLLLRGLILDHVIVLLRRRILALLLLHETQVSAVRPVLDLVNHV